MYSVADPGFHRHGGRQPQENKWHWNQGENTRP